MSFHQDKFHSKYEVVMWLKKMFARQQKQHYDITQLMSELEAKNMDRERRMLYDILENADKQEIALTLLEDMIEDL